MIRKIFSFLLAMGCLCANGATQTKYNVFFDTSWIDGVMQYSQSEIYISVVGDEYPSYLYPFEAGQTYTFKAAVKPGHEITMWSRGNPSETGVTGLEHFSTVISSTSDTYQWTKMPSKNQSLAVHQDWIKYDIDFSGNGSTGGDMASQTDLVYNQNVALSANAYEKTGHSFAGWKRRESPTGTYSDRATVSGATFGLDYKNKSVTLDAQWTPNVYTVTLDANGGTFSGGGTQQTRKITYGETYGEFPTGLTRDGYTFKNSWTNAAGTVVKATDSLTLATDHTLYAQWEALGGQMITTKRVYDDPDAEGSVSDGGAWPWGSTHTLKATPSESSEFSGWTKDDPNGVILSTDRDYDIDVRGPATYYAHFALKEFTVTFKYKDAQGSDVSNSQTVKYGRAATPPNAPDYPHYKFEGWDTSDYKAVKGDLIVNAKYTSTILTVHFDPNGGNAVSPEQLQYDRGDKYADMPTPTRTGYSWDAKWWTKTGGGDPVTADTTVETTGTQTLYPHWTANKYTLTLDPNYEGAPASSTKEVTYDAYYPTLSSGERTGYAFNGWWTGREGGDQVTTSTKVTTADDHTVYAHWTAKQYWVYLNAKGGEGAPGSVQVTYDQPYSGLTSPTRTGYDFKGWWTEETGGTRIQNGERVQITQTTYLYAHWEAKTYTVTFDPRGGTVSETSRSVTYDAKYGDLPQPTRTGYDFSGWWTAVSDGSRVDGEDTVKIVADKTLYAHWKAKTFTVTLNATGGSGVASSIQATYDDVYSLPTPTRTGYGFLGWFTSEEGGVQVKSGDKVQITDHTTVFAHWRANEYTVSFDGNGGTVGEDQRKIAYDAAYGELPTASRTGYSFVEWQLNGTKILPTTVFKKTSDVTLKAAWTANVYTVTFDAAGGTGLVEKSRTVKFDSTYGTLPTVTRAGYGFDGWYAENGLKVESTTTYAVAKDQTLTAHWGAKKFTVSFARNGGSGDPMDAQEFTWNQPAALTLNTYTRQGYSFSGWATGSAAQTAAYADGQTVSNLTENASITLYAVWTAKEYAVHYDANGGTGEMASQTMTWGTSQKLTENAFARRGYSFLGWSEDKEAVLPAYSNGETIGGYVPHLTEGPSVTLYAVWEANPYRIYFNANGGTGYMGYEDAEWDVPVVLPEPTFTRTGHAPAGWSTNSADAVARFKAGDSVSNLVESGSVTVYAIWTPNRYAVRFERNGGNQGADMPDEQLTYGVPAALPPCTFANGIRGFDGWLGSDGLRYADGATVSNLTSAAGGAFTMTAQWADTYAIAFDGNGHTSGTMAPQLARRDELVALSSNRFARIGYTYRGWATTVKEAATWTRRFTDGQTVENLAAAGETKTLYAVWTNNVYRVRFHPNGGEGSVFEREFAYDVAQNLPGSAAFKKDGQELMGWLTDPTNAVCMAAGSSVSNLAAKAGATVSLFAKWSSSGPVTSDLAKAADANVELTASSDDWCKIVEGDCAYPKPVAKCIQLKPEGASGDDEEVKLRLAAAGAGTLAFRFKEDFDTKYSDEVDQYAFFLIRVDGNDYKTIRPGSRAQWEGPKEFHIDGVQSSIELVVSVAYNDYLDYSVRLDGITWIPDKTTVGVTYRLNDGTVAPADIWSNVTHAAGQPIGTLPVLTGEGFDGWSTTTAAFGKIDANWTVPVTDTQLYAVWKSGEHPVPTAKDAPTVGGFTPTAGGFSLSFASDARFDYRLLSTATLVPPDWQPTAGVDVKTGTGGALTFEIDAGREGTPGTEFFKVEVLQRGN